jgi:putative pectin methyltransferase
MSRLLYKGALRIGVKPAAVYYDPKEPSENDIGGCGRAARRRHLVAAAVKIGVLVLTVAALVGCIAWAGMLYTGHRAAACAAVAAAHHGCSRL